MPSKANKPLLYYMLPINAGKEILGNFTTGIGANTPDVVQKYTPEYFT
jgi:hypothetical protein